MKLLYEKIVIVKVEILGNPSDSTHHQTTIHVQKEMSPKEYITLIDTMNFLQKVKRLVKDGVIK